jgi:hypothetical protein
MPSAGPSRWPRPKSASSSADRSISPTTPPDPFHPTRLAHVKSVVSASSGSASGQGTARAILDLACHRAGPGGAHRCRPRETRQRQGRLRTTLSCRRRCCGGRPGVWTSTGPWSVHGAGSNPGAGSRRCLNSGAWTGCGIGDRLDPCHEDRPGRSGGCSLDQQSAHDLGVVARAGREVEGGPEDVPLTGAEAGAEPAT